MAASKEARLDRAVVLGGFLYNTPNLYKLGTVADDIAKHCEFTAEEVRKHLEQRLHDAVDLNRGTDKPSEPIGFHNRDK